MRLAMLGAIAVVVALVPSAGYAADCPADAFKASMAIWPLGAIKTGQTKTARHPCGRQITCVGGSFQPKTLRTCHWD